MSKFYKQSFSSFVLLLLLSTYALMSSCVSTKNIVYFHKDLPDTFSAPVVMNKTTQFVDPKIESNDILSISVQPLLQNILSAPSGGSSSGSSNAGNVNAGGMNYGTTSANGYLVDKNGYIEYSLIGPVKVGGLSTTEAKELIEQKAKEYYKDPVVYVRILNFDYSILGDVNRPGKFNSPSEKVSIIDAIVESGDLQLSAKRDNILLVRSVGDQKIFARYDLSSKEIFNNPYYYLKQRDVIYVEPNKYKVQSSDQTFIRNLGILSSLISLASIILVFKSIK